jgi:membrane dipeptidase
MYGNRPIPNRILSCSTSLMNRFSFALAASLLALCAPLRAEPPDPADPNLPRLKKLLATAPLIDGHNDWGETLVGRAGDKRWTMDLTKLDHDAYDTDIERLHQGMVGGQFWSVFVSPALPGPEQVKATLEQIDLPMISCLPVPPPT